MEIKQKHKVLSRILSLVKGEYVKRKGKYDRNDSVKAEDLLENPEKP